MSTLCASSLLLQKFEQDLELSFQNVALYSYEQLKEVLNIYTGMTVRYCQYVLSGSSVMQN